MSFLLLVLVGLAVGVTTVLFGFGGGFVTVPVITVVDVGLGGDAVRVAVATSALVMLVNAAVATAATRPEVLRGLRGGGVLLVLLAAGGALGAFAGRFAPDPLLRWGFVAYVGVTIVDLLVRPGFLRPPSSARPGGSARGALAGWVGAPVGAVAAFLGVGGSVMTVPMMRRGGATMAAATALANPLTLAIAAPALAVSLLVRGGVAPAPGLVGGVDVGSAAALLVGAIPVVVLLRRRPPRIPDRLHAWTYLALLAAAAGTVAAVG
ncbi:TSUP family transporter [Isoptericola sp. F-RaC21]|uniref:TSUP family transporter n=1 Tax=Isoptericola sp. F-RaC21 TaxID=3141452 RepID=UPI00315B91E7